MFANIRSCFPTLAAKERRKDGAPGFVPEGQV
jgi:hypothetical protein